MRKVGEGREEREKREKERGGEEKREEEREGEGREGEESRKEGRVPTTQPREMAAGMGEVEFHSLGATLPEPGLASATVLKLDPGRNL